MSAEKDEEEEDEEDEKTLSQLLIECKKEEKLRE